MVVTCCAFSADLRFHLDRVRAGLVCLERHPDRSGLRRRCCRRFALLHAPARRPPRTGSPHVTIPGSIRVPERTASMKSLNLWLLYRHKRSSCSRCYCLSRPAPIEQLLSIYCPSNGKAPILQDRKSAQPGIFICKGGPIGSPASGGLRGRLAWKTQPGRRCMLAAYRKLFPALNFVHFDGGRIARKLAKHIPRLRSGMLAGGTIIGQMPEWLEIAKAFLKIHPELVVFGSGVEEPSFWQGETTLEDWKPVLEQCRSIGVRGP